MVGPDVVHTWKELLRPGRLGFISRGSPALTGQTCRAGVADTSWGLSVRRGVTRPTAQLTPGGVPLDYFTNREMKSRQVWATSCQPESIVRECLPQLLTLLVNC